MNAVSDSHALSSRPIIIPSPPTSPALPARAPPSLPSVCPAHSLHRSSLPHIPHFPAPPTITPLSLSDRHSPRNKGPQSVARTFPTFTTE